jgi:apolipoprotein N-acyltransferase
MNKFIYLIITALLCYLAYFISAYFIFFLFVPFFFLVKSIVSKRDFIYIYLFILIQNIIPTYWLASVQIYQGISAWVVNSLLLFFFVFIAIKITSQERIIHRLLTIISFWIAFEYFHHIWIFNWPWLTLGNIFSKEVNIIQWYKYSGVFGGSIWILIINFLIFNLIINSTKFKIRDLIFLIVILVIPIAFSINIYGTKLPSYGNFLKTVIVQPNANTTNKYINELEILDKIFDSTIINTDLVLLTETFIKESIWQNRIQDGIAIQKIEAYLKKLKIANCITGLLIKKMAMSNTGKRFNETLNIRYDLYDAAICIDTSSNKQFHYKSKLIPVEENLPNFLSSFNLKTDNFSIGNDFNNFIIKDGIVVSTGICFETLFTDAIAKMCNKGSSIILMTANEQMISGIFEKNYYTNICKIRAIENGKYLAKSSNIGFTGLIDPKGNIIEQLSNNEFGVKKINIPIVTNQTFYTKNHQKINFFIIIQGILVFMYSVYVKIRVFLIAKRNQ